MYMFEFEYTFDKDDLAYIWQNLAPRNFEKLTIEHQSVAHELMDLELLNEHNIMDNENLRWMVFKVKQRAQTDYYDLITTQADVRASSISDRFTNLKPPFSQGDNTDSTYKIRYNWPYDYLSLVEQIKLDAEVLYKPDAAQQQLAGETQITGPAVQALTPVIGSPPIAGTTPTISGPAAAALLRGGAIVGALGGTVTRKGEGLAARMAPRKGKRKGKKTTLKSTKKSTKKY
jgi:hypothetical protein